MLKMAPLVALMASAMYIAVFTVFKPHKLHFNEQAGITILKKRLGVLSFGLMTAFLIALQFKAAVFMLPFIALVYLIFNRKVLFDVDWLLIVTFILMFIDFALLAKLRPLSAIAGSIDMSKSRNVFAVSALLSQFISNVPASIFISKFSVNWQAIAYGVDVAGNGT
jgi:hypothetical protein